MQLSEQVVDEAMLVVRVITVSVDGRFDEFQDRGMPNCNPSS